MDLLKWGAAAVLAAAFAGALLVRDNGNVATAAVVLPDICGDVHAAHSDHGAMDMQAHIDGMAAAADPAHAALYQTMEPMHSDMMRGMTAADFDTAFVCGMIPHHQGAVDMAVVGQQYSNDPFVKIMAQQIITDQQMEIREMQAWLSRKAVSATLPDPS